MAASAVGGLWLGVGATIDRAGDYLSTHEAAAATYSRAITLPARMPHSELDVTPQLIPQGQTTSVFGPSDAALLEPLAAAPLVRVKPNHGGTSLSLRVDFANGSRAAFKPEQIHPQSDPRREVAAYRIDRLLGIGHVAPAKPVKFTMTELVAAIDPTVRTYTIARLDKEAKPKQGVLRGMLAWWIPEIRDAKLGGLDLHEPAAQKQLIEYLQIGAEVPPLYRPIVEQFATCIIFDVIIDNSDRWTGSNTKVSPDQQTLYFMDNTLSFSTFRHGHDSNIKPLRAMQVFPRKLVARLRSLTVQDVRAALDLGDDSSGLGPLLDDERIHALLQRRNHVLEHIDQLIKLYGEDAVLALP